jgi:tetratricopeptide (TPR) repeat protein
VRADTRPELLGAIAHHFDSALALEAEVTPLEPPEPALVETTVASLLAAGEWARANAALSEAVRLFRRAGDVSAGRANLQERSNAQLAVALVRSGAEAKAVEVAEAVLAATTAPEAIALASFALGGGGAQRGSGRGDPTARRAGARGRAAAGLAAVESQAHHLLGWHCFWAGEVLEAEIHQLRASETALELGDKGLAASALAYAGDMAMWRGELELANDRIERAMQLARESGSVRAIAAGHVTLSRVRRAQDRGEEAVELGREGARLFLEVEERFFAATMYPFAIAEPLIDRGLLDEAWASLEQGLEIARPLHSAAVEGPIRIRRAQVLLAWDRPEEAEAELKAVTPERGFGQDDAQAVLAEVRAAQGQDGEAERLWRELFARLPEEQKLDQAELQLPFATFLATRRRDQEAQVVLANVRSIIADAGAALLERQAADVEALLNQH